MKPVATGLSKGIITTSRSGRHYIDLQVVQPPVPFKSQDDQMQIWPRTYT